MNIERRLFKIEVRKDDEGKKMLAGTPIVYGKRSEDMGFYEYIKRGAATEALKTSDTRLLYGHNSDTLLPIARQKSGTLRSKEDKSGVHIEADPPKKNQFVDALMESIERGDIGEMSFGFTVEEDEWKDIDTDKPTRTIKKIGDLIDYSYVTFAAYNDTEVALRSLNAAKEKVPDPTDEKKPDSTDVEKVIEPRIIIISKGEKTEQFDFAGDKRFEQAADKINSLRSELNPTIPDSDNADDGPTIKKPSDTDKAEQDDTLERINETIERLRNEDHKND